MRKDAYDRINEVLNDIRQPAFATTLFAGFDAAVVRKIVLTDINYHWTDDEIRELSELLSIGGVRIIKFSDETETRKLKRCLMLFHRVPGYHTHFETLSLKQTVLNQRRADVLPKAEYEIQRALRFMTDEDIWARDIAVRHSGNLVHFYNQGRDNRLNEFDKTENGWCLGMSVHWLACRAQRMDFWGTHLSETGAAKYRFVMAAQGVRTATGTTQDRASFRLKKYGLDLKVKNSEDQDQLGDRMAEMITDSGQSFIRIGQYYTEESGGGGHAMAATLEQGGVRFLDPNLGEFFFKTIGSFRSWYPYFVRKMDYRFEEYYIEGYSLRTASPAPTQELKDALAGRRAAMGFDE